MNPAHRLSWLLWVSGTALVIGSWIDVVTPQIGWIGFGIACSGSLLSSVSNRISPPVVAAPVTSHLCGACLLHQSNECRRPERPTAVTCPEFMKA